MAMENNRISNNIDYSFLKNIIFLRIAVVTLLNNFIVAAIISMEILYIVSFLKKSSFHLALFMMLGAVLSIIITPVFGRMIDKSPETSKKLMIAACITGLIGCIILYLTKNFLIALMVEILLFTVARSINPALIAQSYATSYLAGDANKTHWVSVHRALTSAGWIVAPPMAGLIVDAFGFQEFFIVIGVIYILMLILFSITKQVKPRRESGIEKVIEHTGIGFWGFFSVFVLMFFTMFVLDTNLPLLVKFLGGHAKEVGLLFSIAGVGEVILITFGGYFVKHFSDTKIIILIVALGMVYSLISHFANSLSELYFAQLIYGAYLGLMLGTSYLLLQKLRPNEPGLVAAYYYNSFKICKMIGAGSAAILNGFFNPQLVAIMPIIPLVLTLTIYVYMKHRASSRYVQ
ncbi:MAG: MFS transporter [Paraglaciecola sp.]|nr:MFS transporter [Paraglaciecola sp.]